MLKAKNLPKILWAAAVDNAAYLRNRAYTREHLQPFGCTVWIIDENQTKGKLDARAKAHIFTGWVENLDAFSKSQS
jgi:hypothetical protein